MKYKFTCKVISMICLSLMLPFAMFSQAGSLDLSFDFDGKVTTAIGTTSDIANAIAIQNDGKIVAVGTSYMSFGNEFVVVRYNVNGSLDATFDLDGMVTTSIGVAGTSAYAVAIQTDGKIVVAGETTIGNKRFAVVRYNTNGSLDTSFSADGKVSTAIGATYDVGQAIAIQTDGKILVSGYSHNGTNYDVAVVRYNTNGSLDATFDTDGIVTTAIDTSGDFGNSIAIQSNGKIVVGGYVSIGLYNDFALIRYNTDGSLDTTFDFDGKLVTPIGTSNDGCTAIAIQSDGKIVAAGSSFNGANYDFAVIRYNTNGSLDNSFDLDGKVTTAVGSSNDRGYTMKIQSDGKILVAGTSKIGTTDDFALVRYNTNGSLDLSFDLDGKVTTAFGTGDDNIYCMALQTDGKIVVAGGSINGIYDDLAVARYNNSITTGFEAMELGKVDIYPNPFNNVTSICLNQTLDDGVLSLFDAMGQKVRTISHLSGKNMDKLLLKRDNLPAGLYFIHLHDGAKIIAKEKLLVQD